MPSLNLEYRLFHPFPVTESSEIVPQSSFDYLRRLCGYAKPRRCVFPARLKNN